MLKRISLVWKRSELSRSEFRRLWLGAHVDYARRLAGVRGYTIDFVDEGPDEGPDGIATLIFDSRQALDVAFSEPALNAALQRTRDEFASRVQIMLVDENVII